MLQRYGKTIAFLLLLAFCFVIVQFRYAQTDVLIFRFFWWNLLLAVIPYLTSEMLKGSLVRTALLAMTTVLFLPNAPYMVTDLFHLRTRAEFPLWYDALLIFWFAMVGMALYYLTVFNLERYFMRFVSPVFAHFLIAVICFLNGFGIYLGRYLRFNSWDLLSNSDDLTEQILDKLINPSANTRAIGVTLLYGGTLLAGFWIIKLYKAGERTTVA